jgi:DNA-binding response OmpR family regulator
MPMPVPKIPPSREIRTILMISPDEGMAAALEDLFILRKYIVMNEKTAKHALQTASLIMPALIIFNLDPHTPEHIALCRTLRSITQGPILLLAPREEHAHAFEYYQAGVVDEHIPVPVNPLELWMRSLVWLTRQEYAQTHRESLPKYAS